MVLPLRGVGLHDQLPNVCRARALGVTQHAQVGWPCAVSLQQINGKGMMSAELTSYTASKQC
jgi:hypothetical protein